MPTGRLEEPYAKGRAPATRDVCVSPRNRVWGFSVNFLPQVAREAWSRLTRPPTQRRAQMGAMGKEEPGGFLPAPWGRAPAPGPPDSQEEN